MFCKLTEVKSLPPEISSVRAIGKPMHIPKGWKEKTGGIHLGNGVWALVLEREEYNEEGQR